MAQIRVHKQRPIVHQQHCAVHLVIVTETDRSTNQPNYNHTFDLSSFLSGQDEKLLSSFGF